VSIAVDLNYGSDLWFIINLLRAHQILRYNYTFSHDSSLEKKKKRNMQIHFFLSFHFFT